MTDPAHRLRGVLLGVPLFLTALLLFAALDATAKHLSAFFAVPFMVWVRYLVHFVFMLITVAPSEGRTLFLTQHPWLMTLRALMLVGVTLFMQLALQTLPLAETSALVFTTPLLVALLAGPLLGEKVTGRAWLATMIGFAGALLIARPGGALFGVGVAYAAAAALCYALYQILTRKLVGSETQLRLLFYTAMVGTLCMAFAPFTHWNGEWPSLAEAALLASLGLYGGVGHFLMIRAFREANASTLAPLLYVQLIWATLLGWLVFSHLPDLLAIIGMLVIGASGLTLALAERRKK
ncbi:MAG: DMT family transporter [Betaproteobacteria bacterium]|jgi:drug/metabolite transporter (DMT)-like permease|nr:DMT family transporter [Betaproteobacteria bacterium]